jgi:hypothetical protein
MRDHARFPEVPRDAGHYESFYVKAARDGRAVWLRHTAFKRPGEAPVGSLWAVLYDDSWERPVAWKASFEEISADEGFVRIGPARLTEGLAEGPSWRLELAGDAPAFPYLPREWMYRAKLPKTKALSLYPSLSVSGWMEVGGRRLELDAWPGMIGHNWGAEHAETWVWLQGEGLDVTFGRVRVGPVTLPWVANGLLELDGRRVRLGGLGRRGTQVDAAPGRLSFALPGPDGLVVDGVVDAARERTVGWRYSDPGGGEHQVLNSSIADLRAVLRTGDGAERELTALGTTAYELGVRDAQGYVPIEPFPDP